MLPGISAEDCLFADLGIDPSFMGCQTVEATDLLLRNRPLITSGHVLIWQVGVVGDPGFNFKGFKYTKFSSWSTAWSTTTARIMCLCTTMRPRSVRASRTSSD